eukprot:gene3346-3669_t
MVWIKYFIPEDGDDIQHPNLFQIEGHSGEVVTLAQVVEGFPLPGRYHFRFLRSFSGAAGGGGATVWMDLPQPSSAVPSYQGSVLAKVSRLALSSSGSGGGGGGGVATAKPPRPAAPPAPAPPTPAVAAAAAEPSEKLLNFHDDDLSPSPPPPAAASGSSAPAPSIFDSDDLLGMGATSTTTASNPLTASLPPPTASAGIGIGSASGGADPFGLQTLQPMAPPPAPATTAQQQQQQRFYPSRVPMATSMGSGKAMGSAANGAYDPFQGLGATNPSSSSSYRR